MNERIMKDKIIKNKTIKVKKDKVVKTRIMESRQDQKKRFLENYLQRLYPGQNGHKLYLQQQKKKKQRNLNIKIMKVIPKRYIRKLMKISISLM